MQQKQTNSWPLLPFTQLQQIPPVIPSLMPVYIDYPDPLFINYEPGSNIPGPAGPAGAQGPTGSLANVPVTLVDAASYLATAEEYFLGVIYNGATKIMLPQGILGKVFVIKDSAGDANTSPITVVAVESTIDGLPTYTIDSNWNSVELLYNGIEWNVI